MYPFTELLEQKTISWFNIKRKIFSFVLCITLITLCPLVFAEESEQPTDKEVKKAIENRLAKDDAVTADYIDVTVNEGIVTFEGTVKNILEKERAAKIAENLKGVRSVINQIQVKPIDRSDEKIRNSVEEALSKDSVVDVYDISVRVNDGRVILTGMVQSWAEKDICEKITKNVKGITEIANQITIRYQAERRDEEIESDIVKRLEWDVLVREKLIDVNVQDGVVMLKGTVGSLAEKNRAKELALVNGVRRIDADMLTVDWEKFSEEKKKSEWGADHINKSDDEIEQAVKDAFLYDPRLASFNPKITVEEGVGTLRGIVGDLKAKQAAKRDALNTVGVWKVINLLKVRPADRRSPEEIASDIRESIDIDPYLDEHEVSVTVIDNTAYLNGNVDSGFEEQRAVNAAWGTRGVVDVKDYLTVGHEWLGKSDFEIQTEVKDEMWWSPFVDANQVNVKVENGVVTLTGTVDTWAERKSARENAFEGRAKDVVNKLYVDYGPEYFIR